MWDTIGKYGSMHSGAECAGNGEPILGLGLHLNSSPWRLGPAWAVLAGAIAGQAPIWDGGGGLLRLSGSLLLADALWGIFWRRPFLRQEAQPGRQPQVGLPYSVARSPMMQILTGLRWEESEETEIGWQGALAGLGLVALLSVLLGSSAIVLSLLALIASVTVRLSVRRGKRPALVMALLGTALPWALGIALGGSGNRLLPVPFTGAGLVLGAAFTALSWSVTRADLHVSGGLVWPIWAAQIGVLAALGVIREPFGLAIVGGCFIVPSLWLLSWPGCSREVGAIVRNSNPWWLASMLAAALAVRY
jgi:hypothetical protein